MKRLSLLLNVLLLGFLPALATAEVRLVNATGTPLRIDLLHKEAQFRDIDVPAELKVTAPVGSPLGPNGSEMIVVKDTSGNELLRKELKSDRVYVIKKWGDGLLIGQVERYKGEVGDTDQPVVLNLTGRRLKYKVEYPDFTTFEGKGGEISESFPVTTEAIGRSYNYGETLKVTFLPEGLEPLETSLNVGTFYLMERNGSGLSLTKINGK